MRLGVNTVDIFSGDHIALNVRSDLDDFALVEAVKRTHQELAVDVIELPANLMVICPRLFSGRTLEALGKYQADSGIGYTVHLPFRGLDVSSLCRPLWEASVESYKRVIRRFEDILQVEHYVLHLTETMLKQVQAKPHMEQKIKAQITETMYLRAKEGLQQVMADVPPVQLLLENIKSGWREPFAIAEELQLGICCDVGHLILEGADPREVIGCYRGLIREYHFHDVVEWTLGNGKTILQDHVGLGMGLLKVGETLDLMLADQFDGILLIEVGHWEAAEQSVRVVREYLAALD